MAVDSRWAVVISPDEVRLAECKVVEDVRELGRVVAVVVLPHAPARPHDRSFMAPYTVVNLDRSPRVATRRRERRTPRTRAVSGVASVWSLFRSPVVTFF